MKERADFIPQNFDDMLLQKGMKMDWEEAMVCPCIGETGTGQPDYNCKLCGRTGFIYAPPIEIKGASTGLNGKRNFDNIGFRETGTAYITVPNPIILGYHDRVTFNELTSKYSQPVTFSFGKSINLKRPVLNFELIYKDGNYLDINMFTLEKNGWSIVASEELVARYGDNFVVSVLFMTHPVYCVIDIMHELRATYSPDDLKKELPKQYMLKREDFLYEVRDKN